jgi:wyosine [tRNA(Phe)-imidazoG37] synthetase (radical SAM superfamily)
MQTTNGERLASTVEQRVARSPKFIATQNTIRMKGIAENILLDPPKLLKSRRPNQTVFGYPREFLGNRFVYAVISPRAKGLSVGVNMNPDKYCNFHCAYCEVDRTEALQETKLDVDIMAGELQKTLAVVRSGAIRESSFFNTASAELLQLKHVALSGDGEPTLCPSFVEAVQSVMHVRACSRDLFFKIVLITNGTGLDLPQVQEGLRYFTRADEIWIKLEAGTQTYMDKVNEPDVSLEKITANILLIARQRPVVIQSLFPMIDGGEPSEQEIANYAQRLLWLKDEGAQISLVQIYSATRPQPNSACGHLPLRTLSRIAQTVRDVAGLKAEVF